MSQPSFDQVVLVECDGQAETSSGGRDFRGRGTSAMFGLRRSAAGHLLRILRTARATASAAIPAREIATAGFLTNPTARALASSASRRGLARTAS